jgi:hypothetical protein
MADTTRAEAQDLSYVVYDKVTGKPIARHRRFDMATNKLIEADEAEILSLYANDAGAMQRVTEGDAANLSILRASVPNTQVISHMRVTKNKLVEPSRLVMISDKDELEGDGKDQATLTIMLQNDKGKVTAKADNIVLVTTTRGKLSARGGLVALEKGRITLTLTSVPETVQVVKVRAELQDGGAEPAEIHLAFM